MGNRLTPTSAPGHVPAPPPWTRKAAGWLRLFPRLLAGMLSWLRRPPSLLGSREEEQAAEGREEVSSRRTALDGDHLEISFNLVRHLFDMCAVAFLCLASPVFRVSLDVLRLRGLAGLWLHGMGLFLVTSYGMALVLWLLHAYLAQLVLVYGALQLLVLGVSLRPGHQGPPDTAEDSGGGASGLEQAAGEPLGLRSEGHTS